MQHVLVLHGLKAITKNYVTFKLPYMHLHRYAEAKISYSVARCISAILNINFAENNIATSFYFHEILIVTSWCNITYMYNVIHM